MKNYDVPDTNYAFNVIQLYISPESQPWIFGRSIQRRFGEILEEILKKHELPFEWMTIEESSVPEAPALENPGFYSVAGLSIGQIAGDTHHFFEIPSWTYSRETTKIDEQHLKAFQRLNPEFKYEIHRYEPPQPGPARLRLVK